MTASPRPARRAHLAGASPPSLTSAGDSAQPSQDPLPKIQGLAVPCTGLSHIKHEERYLLCTWLQGRGSASRSGLGPGSPRSAPTPPTTAFLHAAVHTQKYTEAHPPVLALSTP